MNPPAPQHRGRVTIPASRAALSVAGLVAGGLVWGTGAHVADAATVTGGVCRYDGTGWKIYSPTNTFLKLYWTNPGAAASYTPQTPADSFSATGVLASLNPSPTSGPDGGSWFTQWVFNGTPTASGSGYQTTLNQYPSSFPAASSGAVTIGEFAFGASGELDDFLSGSQAGSLTWVLNGTTITVSDGTTIPECTDQPTHQAVTGSLDRTCWTYNDGSTKFDFSWTNPNHFEVSIPLDRGQPYDPGAWQFNSYAVSGTGTVDLSQAPTKFPADSSGQFSVVAGPNTTVDWGLAYGTQFASQPCTVVAAGRIEIAKSVSGSVPTAVADGTVKFGFTLDCTGGYHEAFTLAANQSLLFDEVPLPQGTCTLAETSQGGASQVVVTGDGGTGNQFSIDAATDVHHVHVSNVFAAPPVTFPPATVPGSTTTVASSTTTLDPSTTVGPSVSIAPPSSVEPPAPTVTGPWIPSQLPTTGSDTSTTVWLAAGLASLGLASVATARRRRSACDQQQSPG